MFPHHHHHHHCRAATYEDKAPLSVSSGSVGNMVLSPRSDPALLCKYKSGKCANRRATKRNGQLHTLCHFHRVRQNEHQRKSDRKHRMVNVARRAKLGSIGAILAPERRTRRGSLTQLSDFPSDSSSTPASPMDVGHPFARDGRLGFLSRPQDGKLYASPSEHREGLTLPGFRTSSPDPQSLSSPIHWRSHLTRLAQQGDVQGLENTANLGNQDGLPMSPVPALAPAIGTPTGRLPPISFLTQQAAASKSESYRSENASLRGFSSGSYASGSHAGKSA